MSLTEASVEVPKGVESRFDAGIVAIAYSRAGVLAAGLGDGTIQLVDGGGDLRSVQAHHGAVLCLERDVDGDGFVSGGDDGRLVRTAADGGTHELLASPRRQLDALAVSATAKLRAVGVGTEVHLLDADGNVTARTPPHPSTVAGLAFNPKGKRLAVAHYGGVTLRWTSMLDRNASRLKWQGSHIGVTWSPDGRYLLTAMQERELHGWRVEDGKDMAMRGYMTKVRSVSWLAKPPLLATSGTESIIAWPFAGAGPNGKAPLQVARGIGRLVTQVAVHPSRALVAAAFDDGSLVLSELATDRESRVVRLRTGGDDQVSALAWSSDGLKIAMASGSGRLTVFDLAKRAH